MKKRVFLISKCFKFSDGRYQFHFRGRYRGFKITRVYVEARHLEIGQEYLLAVDEQKIVNEVLFAKLVKAKLLIT